MITEVVVLSQNHRCHPAPIVSDSHKSPGNPAGASFIGKKSIAAI